MIHAGRIKDVKIKERNHILILREEFAQARKILRTRFRGLHFSSVQFCWLIKESTYGGWCWKQTRQIFLNRKYLDGRWKEEMMRMTLRHELAHLVAEDRGHGRDFLWCLEQLKGHRYVGAPVYEGRKPKKK